MEEGAKVGVGFEEQVHPESRVRELEKRVAILERMLGRKTEEVEILKEAVRLGREKKLISRQPLQGLENFEWQGFRKLWMYQDQIFMNVFERKKIPSSVVRKQKKTKSF